MRIEQLYCNFGHGWRDAAINKFKLRPYTDARLPVFLVGCYITPQYWMLHNHAATYKSFALVFWAGTDAQNLAHHPGFGGYDGFWACFFRQYQDRIKHIAISHWIAEDLKSLDIPYVSLPVTLYDWSDVSPCPLGDSVYMYNPDSAIYNGGIYQEIKKRLPYNFIEATWKTYQRPDLIEAYKKCFIGLRFTNHDGLSHTASEMGLMGRPIIHNGDLPNCLTYGEDIDEICETIDRVHSLRNAWEYKSYANEVSKYLSIDNDFLNTEYYDLPV